MKAEGLKVRMQYESMYGEPHEAINESWIDRDTISDIAIATMQHVLVPKLTEHLQGLLSQFQQTADRLQQMQDKAMKYMPGLAGQMLLRYLYEDPPGAP